MQCDIQVIIFLKKDVYLLEQNIKKIKNYQNYIIYLIILYYININYIILYKKIKNCIISF